MDSIEVIGLLASLLQAATTISGNQKPTRTRRTDILLANRVDVLIFEAPATKR